MKRISLALSLIIFIVSRSLGQTTTLTEDANGVLNTGKIVSQTSTGQIFYLGHQLGSGYAFPYGIFRATHDIFIKQVQVGD